jgi:hypothetical protein
MTLGGASSERGVSSYIYEPLVRSDSTKRWRGRTASAAVNDALRQAGKAWRELPTSSLAALMLLAKTGMQELLPSTDAKAR